RVVISVADSLGWPDRAGLVHVLDGDTGEPVVPAFPSGRSSGSPGFTFSIESIQPNLGATRLIVPGRSSTGLRLICGDGPEAPNQPDALGAGTEFPPDGGSLVTVGGDNSARVWDAWTGLPVTPRLPHDGPVGKYTFTPDGSHVVVVAGQGVWVWPLAWVE